ncbi:sodium/solute symporter [Parapedobacter deserti]|uniref:Sodium/solute symporter n=1 Tax=Parapedobacter deserti TaxID=1912957 RepID=A0ABV7JIX1_9SPHI
MRIFILLCFLLSSLPFTGSTQHLASSGFRWDQLPPLPDQTGFAGAFSGVSNDALIVAGGANFPTGMPWEGGAKVWHDEVFVLRSPQGEWIRAAKLQRPLAYGTSITTTQGLLCIGGNDQSQHSSDVFMLIWNGQEIIVEEYPSLPVPLAYSAGAIIGKNVYLAGGLEASDSATPASVFLKLDLSDTTAGWTQLDTWPGPPRMLAVAGTIDQSFYLISGVDLEADSTGKTRRSYLKDAYRYTPSGEWQQIADLPNAVAAAPSPAMASGQNHLLVLGGDEGSHFFRQAELRERHPGFNRTVLGYHAVTDTWAALGALPSAVGGNEVMPAVTTPLVTWRGKSIIPTGEIKPGIRSPQVIQVSPTQQKSGFATVDIGILVTYFLVVIGIGIYYSNSEKTQRDYFLGGNRIPWWAAGISIFATQLSAITFMAIPAKAFSTNWVYVVANMTIIAVAPIVIAIYLPFFRRLNIITAYEYLEKRFGLAARWTAGVAFILFQLGRMGIVIFLPSLALNAVLDVNIYLCIALIGGLSTTYTFLGGIEADIWNDMFQAFLLIGCAIVSLILITSSIDGGLGEIISMGMEEGKFKLANMTWDMTTDALWVVIIGSFFANIVSYTSDQAVIQRYLSTKDEKKSAKSIWTNAILAIPATLLFFSVGTALWAFYKTHPQLLNPASRSDDIFPWFIAQQLPAGVSGLVITAIFAAAMSSVDSSVNSMSAVITNDFYKRLKPAATDKQCMKLAHRATLMLGLIGIGTASYIAFLNSPSMWDQYLKIVGLFGGALAGMFMVGIFVRRVHLSAVLVGFFGAAGTLFAVQQFTSIHLLLYAAIGIFVCFFLSVLASYLIPGPKGDDHLIYRRTK